jgi:Icc-related predicted phosphoesterase
MKVVIISDTHNLHKHLEIPECDLIICAGDFSHNEWQCSFFVEWLATLPIPNKILVAGNHDYHVKKLGKDTMTQLCETLGIHYLQDSGCEINNIKFWGSPYSMIFGPYPFMAEDFELEEIWDLIPLDTQVLITHGPAYNTGDRVRNKWTNGNYINVGSRTLQNRILELPNLTHHIFGHIHECYGIYRDNYKKLISINASILNQNQLCNVNEPILIDV